MENTEDRAVIEALTANVLNTRFEDIEPEAVDNTKKRILDTIGDAIGGIRATGNTELVELVKSWGGQPEATILADGAKGPVHDVAMVNCVLCRGFDRGPLTLLVDGKRFRLAAYAIAYLTILIGVAGFLIFRGLGKTVVCVGIWLAASPLIFASWLSLRYPENKASGKGGALPSQAREVPPSEKATP